MAELLVGVVLVGLLVRVLSEGEPVELDDLIGLPQFAALAAFLGIIAGILIRSRQVAEGGHYSALAMLGLAATGVLLVLFPERMPDTRRGGTLMTTFWMICGWLLIAVAAGVVAASPGG